MKLTVLGNNGPFPGAGGACSGYLLDEDGYKILLDCGSGILGNLQKVCNLEQIDMIILTHLHSDHISDMTVLRYYYVVKKARGEESKRLKIYCPTNPADEFKNIDKEHFEIEEINDGKKININGMEVSFSLMDHPYENYAVSIFSKGKKFVYSGDTGYIKKLSEFAISADLLLVDANLTEKFNTGNKLPHMTGKQCGQTAKDAGVKKLILTHFWPFDDNSIQLKEAKKLFENTENSEILKSYSI